MPSRRSARSRSAPLRPVALVTGAAKRIGREIALALAHDGWDIAVHYASSRGEARQTADQIEAIGRRALLLRCDLGAESKVRKLLAQCEAGLGQATCIVNNASLFEHDEATHFDSNLFTRHMQINVAAPLVLAQTLHAALPAGVRGVVINLLDQRLFNPDPDFLSYALSKAALGEATTLLALALAPKVRVVGLAPGVTMISRYQSKADFARSHHTAPLGRASTPQDIAAAAVYLARAAAVTGTTLIVDGGQHLACSSRESTLTSEVR